MAKAKAYKMIPHCTKDTITYEMDELVLCDDCKYWNKSKCPLSDLYGETTKDPDWFCADGKRKDLEE